MEKYEIRIEKRENGSYLIKLYMENKPKNEEDMKKIIEEFIYEFEEEIRKGV